MFSITTTATPQTAATIGMPTSATAAAWLGTDVRDRHVAVDVRAAVAPFAVIGAALVKGAATAGTPAWRRPTS